MKLGESSKKQGEKQWNCIETKKKNKQIGEVVVVVYDEKKRRKFHNFLCKQTNINFSIKTSEQTESVNVFSFLSTHPKKIKIFC